MSRRQPRHHKSSRSLGVPHATTLSVPRDAVSLVPSRSHVHDPLASVTLTRAASASRLAGRSASSRSLGELLHTLPDDVRTTASKWRSQQEAERRHQYALERQRKRRAQQGARKHRVKKGSTRHLAKADEVPRARPGVLVNVSPPSSPQRPMVRGRAASTRRLRDAARAGAATAQPRPKQVQPAAPTPRVVGEGDSMPGSTANVKDATPLGDNEADQHDETPEAPAEPDADNLPAGGLDSVDAVHRSDADESGATPVPVSPVKPLRPADYRPVAVVQVPSVYSASKAMDGDMEGWDSGKDSAASPRSTGSRFSDGDGRSVSPSDPAISRQQVHRTTVRELLSPNISTAATMGGPRAQDAAADAYDAQHGQLVGKSVGTPILRSSSHQSLRPRSAGVSGSRLAGRTNRGGRPATARSPTAARWVACCVPCGCTALAMPLSLAPPDVVALAVSLTCPCTQGAWTGIRRCGVEASHDLGRAEASTQHITPWQAAVGGGERRPLEAGQNGGTGAYSSQKHDCTCAAKATASPPSR